MDQLCRICMSGAGDLLDIFVVGAESPSLEEMINECVDVKIKCDDPYPKKICDICMGDVHCAYRFKKNYQVTLKQLKKISLINISQGPENIESVSTRSQQDKHRKTTKITKAIHKQKRLRESKMFSKVKVKRIKIGLVGLNGNGNGKKAQHESNLKEACLQTELQLSEKQAIHTCDICGKMFPKKVGLTVHKHLHRKQRLNHIDQLCREAVDTGTLKCPHCQREFVFKHSLKRHLIKQVCTKEAMGASEKRENIESWIKKNKDT